MFMENKTVRVSFEDVSLYKKPIYRVVYGRMRIEEFELKTLAGCKRRIEKEGIKNYKLYKVEKHIADSLEDKVELIEKG